jgi:hypothetical protein
MIPPPNYSVAPSKLFLQFAVKYIQHPGPKALRIWCHAGRLANKPAERDDTGLPSWVPDWTPPGPAQGRPLESAMAEEAMRRSSQEYKRRLWGIWCDILSISGLDIPGNDHVVPPMASDTDTKCTAYESKKKTCVIEAPGHPCLECIRTATGNCVILYDPWAGISQATAGYRMECDQDRNETSVFDPITVDPHTQPGVAPVPWSPRFSSGLRHLLIRGRDVSLLGKRGVYALFARNCPDTLFLEAAPEGTYRVICPTAAQLRTWGMDENITIRSIKRELAIANEMDITLV